jgi:hypothetical protein
MPAPPGWDTGAVVKTAPPGWDQAAPVAPAGSGDDALVSKYAKMYGVPEDFANRIRGRETGGTPNPHTATSSAGARGVFQLMPGTFKEMGVGDNIEDPEQNTHAGIKYLSQMLQRYHGDETLAAAAYNAGPGAVDAAHGVPNIKETQAYAQATAAPGASTQAPPGWDTGTVQKTAPAGWDAAKPAAESPLEQPAQPGFNPLKSVEQVGSGIVKGVLTAGTDTLGGVNAVLGAGQRAVAGTLTGDIGATVHPFDEARQERLETKTEALPGIHQASEVVGGAGGLIGALTDHIMAAVGHPTHNAEFLGNVGRVLAAQTITDPLTYVPFIGELKFASRARDVWMAASKAAGVNGVKMPVLEKAAQTAADFHDSKLKDSIKHVFGTRPELDHKLEADMHAPVNGKAARLSIEQKHIDERTAESERQGALAKKYKTQIDAAKKFDDLPYEVQQESLREPWRHGSDVDRAKAESEGFKPTKEDLAKFPKPTYTMKYQRGIKHDYITLISPKAPKSWKDTDVVQTMGKKKTESAGFEKSADTNKPIPADMYARLTNRWRLGRNVVAYRNINRDTLEFLQKHGGYKPLASGEPLEQMVNDLSAAPTTYNIPGWSNAMRRAGRAGIQINPFPHGIKNVGDLAELAGGPEAFGKGLAYSAKGLTPEQLAWHGNMGTNVDYLGEAHGPVTWVANKIGSQQALSRLEMGYRQALKEHYDSVLGPSKTIADDYKKAQMIRDALIDYRNVSRFVSALQALGGPFVAFRAKAPEAIWRALWKNPARIEARARGTTDVNQELHKEGQPGNFHYGGPVEEASRALFKPWDTLWSSATVGPVVSAIEKAVSGKEGPIRAARDATIELTPALQTIIPLLERIPGMSQALQRAGVKYPEPPGVSPFNDTLNTVFGSYFSSPVSKKRRREIQNESGTGRFLQ